VRGASDGARTALRRRARTLAAGLEAALAAGLAGALAGVLAVPAPVAADPYPVAVLRALDKVTARVSRLEVPLNRALRFGTLEIVARHCDKRPPEETPESAAFLEIWEVRPGQPIRDVFRGWMFASSPGLAALEHPIYDVWVLDCISEVSAAPDSAAGRSE
jgi:hypothetical protein